jgi:hypothetical protein
MSFLRPERDWDQLRALFGGYLHQDWDEDSATIPLAVADAASDFDDHVLAEFDKLHSLGPDEEAMRSLLRDWGCAVRPEGFGKTPREFVAWIEELLRAELAKRPTP